MYDTADTDNWEGKHVKLLCPDHQDLVFSIFFFHTELSCWVSANQFQNSPSLHTPNLSFPQTAGSPANQITHKNNCPPYIYIQKMLFWYLLFWSSSLKEAILEAFWDNADQSGYYKVTAWHGLGWCDRIRHWRESWLPNSPAGSPLCPTSALCVACCAFSVIGEQCTYLSLAVLILRWKQSALNFGKLTVCSKGWTQRLMEDLTNRSIAKLFPCSMVTSDEKIPVNVFLIEQSRAWSLGSKWARDNEDPLFTD